MKVTDRELIKGCIREDHASQRELFKRYAGKMMAVCLRYSRDRSEAEDILQEAFIKVFDHIATFKGNGALEGWIRRIVVNAALMQYRSRGAGPRELDEELTASTALEPSVYAQLGEQELIELINKLPEGYKMVFNLYVIEGYSHSEIAELLDISESTSRSQLVKSRKLLQTRIQELQRIAV